MSSTAQDQLKLQQLRRKLDRALARFNAMIAYVKAKPPATPSDSSDIDDECDTSDTDYASSNEHSRYLPDVEAPPVSPNIDIPSRLPHPPPLRRQQTTGIYLGQDSRSPSPLIERDPGSYKKQ